jgi:AraC-like DNA-binding protein
LKQLAEKINCQPHHLSQVINQLFGKNFYDFINTFRVEEVKERIKDENYRHLTLLAIAFDCGFNSKATFNSVFKKFSGISPSVYKKELTSANVETV